MFPHRTNVVNIWPLSCGLINVQWRTARGWCRNQNILFKCVLGSRAHNIMSPQKHSRHSIRPFCVNENEELDYHLNYNALDNDKRIDECFINIEYSFFFSCHADSISFHFHMILV